MCNNYQAPCANDDAGYYSKSQYYSHITPLPQQQYNTQYEPRDEPHSCSYCQKFVIDLRKTVLNWHDPSVGDEFEEVALDMWDGLKWPWTRRYIPFEVTAKDVIEAADAGCIFCTWLVDHGGTHFGHKDQQASKVFLQTNNGSGPPSDIQGVSDSGTMREAPFEPGFIFTLKPGLDIFAHPDDPASRLVRNRPIEKNPGSARAFGLMRNWLQECLKSHQHDQRTVFKPTRLIEIVNLKPKVLLRLRDDANDEGQPYVALSYCWGGPQSLMTTKSTESALKFEFPAKRLPQTIRDAVTVASELGVSYLWVDSICIIQDDEVDKAKEISQMPQVYRNATVTILASRAAGASEGFLHERRHSDTTQRSFKLPYKCPVTGVVGSVILLPRSQESESDPHIEPLDPLYCRGWALQERVLASRAIDFGRLQTRWLCNHGERREGYVDGWRQFPLREWEQGELFAQHELSEVVKKLEDWHSGARSSLEDAESFSPWNHLVETYTLRELTLSDDRLLAISGLAERYSGSYQSTYLAGMWHSTLVPDLLWRASMAFRFNGKGSRVHLSPSWSWASVNYSVTFGDSLRLRPPQITLKLIDYQTTLTYANAPFGAVQNGILAVKGRSWSGTLEFKPSGPVRDNSDFTIVEEFAQADEEWSVLQNLDAPEDDLALDNEFNSWPVRLLMISHTFDERSLHCRGLVLHRAIDESNFQRLGTFLLWYPNKIAGEDAVEQDSKVKTSLERKRIKLFDHCKEEIITIV